MFRFLPLIAVVPLLAHAQTTLGTLTGRVVDPSGAAIAGARVTATQAETGYTYSSPTNGAGSFVLQQLTLGTYEVAIEAAGFRKYVRKDIALSVAQTVTVDVTLAVGQLDQTIEVTESAGALQTSTSDLGTTIQRNKVIDLPLSVSGNVRNLEQFIFLAPGVTGDLNNTQISGSPSRGKEVLVDGVATTGVESGGTIPGNARPSVETIGEFKLLRANFNAEYGRTGGGVQIFTTRSGTNQFHGSAYDFLRNDQFDARGFFLRTRSINRQNEFGASFGGPVVIPNVYNGKNKTFFFVVYSGFRFRQGPPNNVISILPNDFRSGDFSRSTNLIYDPATTRIENGQTVRDPFPGNRIPTSRISTVARNVVGLLPQPLTGDVFNNYIATGRATTDSNQINVKIDHAFSDRNRINGYFYRDVYDQAEAETIAGPTTPGRNTGNRNTWVRLAHDYVISPSILSHLQLGFTRGRVTISRLSLGTNWPGQIGLAGVNTGPDTVFPCIDLVSSGYARLGEVAGGACNAVALQVNNSWQVNYSLSVIRGNHAYKFGMDGRFLETNGIDNFQSQGDFQFNSLETALPSNAARTGNAAASFLLGTVDRATARFAAYYPSNRYKYLAWFVQDDWKATRRLTINYGVRHDIYFPRSEKHDNLSSFDPTLPNPAAGGRPGALAFLGSGTNRIGRSTFADTYYKAFAPRFGLAYQLTPRTVLRSGYGIYYALGNANAGLRESLQFSNGFIASPTYATTDNGVTPAFNWDNGFPQSFVRPPVVDPSAANGSALRMIGRNDARPPYMQNWSFTIERELARGMNFEVAYLGVKGTRLGTGLINVNELNPSYLSLGSQLTQAATTLPYPGFRGSLAQSLRPFPQYLDIANNSNPNGNSTYHALQAQYAWRGFHGLDLQASYTWAKTISDADIMAGGGTGGQTTFNRRLESTLAITDVPHILALNYTYTLPFKKNRLVSGWTLTGIHQYQSGVPVLLTANNTLPLFNKALRPDVIAGQSRMGSFGDFDPATDLYINRAAFAVPPAYQFGTAARVYGDLRTFPFLNENFGVIKRTPLTERVTLTFRAEYFNVFNRTVFSAPQANVSNAQFGRVTSQANLPRQGQLALRVDF